MLFNEEPTTTNTPQPAVEPAYGVDFMRGFMLMSLPCAALWGLVAFGIINLESNLYKFVCLCRLLLRNSITHDIL